MKGYHLLKSSRFVASSPGRKPSRGSPALPQSPSLGQTASSHGDTGISRKSPRTLVELGHKDTVLSREEFEQRKAAAQVAKSLNRNWPTTLASAGKELKDNFLKALAEREEANRSGKMTSVIFIRDHNTLGQEVSGCIDYTHRLQTQDFEPYFSGKKRLMPGCLDLCFYNAQFFTSSSSPDVKVIYDDPSGLLFTNDRDRKILSFPKNFTKCSNCAGFPSGPGEDSRRTFPQWDIQVVFYDHNIRTVCSSEAATDTRLLLESAVGLHHLYGLQPILLFDVLITSEA
ncbi:LOW QUALITY PROTEIN: cilia- and flagella-associated protein 299 [Xenentodon cancila]